MLKSILHKIHWKLMSEKSRIAYLRKKGVQIGSGCSIAKNVRFGTEPYLIKIGNDVRLTSNVKFVTHDGGMWVLRRKYGIEQADKFGTIEIGNNVNVGWDVTIMPNVKIGNNCIIGVGAVVTKDIPNDSVAAGVPARVIETLEQYWTKNKDRIENITSMTADEKKEYLIEKFEEFYQ